MLLVGEYMVGLNTCICCNDLSLKTRLVTHPVTSDACQCWHSEHVFVTEAKHLAIPGHNMYLLIQNINSSKYFILKIYFVIHSRGNFLFSSQFIQQMYSKFEITK